MSQDRPKRPALETLEGLIDPVVEGLESAGWELSGLQKTTSEEFRGRWAGESTRSAYLFFHRPGLGDGVSIDGFLDETSQGLRGNLALVLDGPVLQELGSVPWLLEMASRAASRSLPEGYTTPVTVRLVLPQGEEDPGEAEVELRFKLTMPTSAISAGPSSVSALTSATAASFERLLDEVVSGGFEPLP